jgi:hypothetical protein
MLETFAANDFELSGRWPTWIDRLAVRILAHPIRAPLAYISVHIVKTKSVRCFPANGLGTLPRVFRIPSVVRKFPAIISEAVCWRRTAASCHFPFGFSWQTVNPFTGFFLWPSRKAITEILGLVPSHVLDRQSLRLWRIREMTWIFAHNRFVLSLCDFMNSEIIVSTYGRVARPEALRWAWHSARTIQPRNRSYPIPKQSPCSCAESSSTSPPNRTIARPSKTQGRATQDIQSSIHPGRANPSR